MDRDTLLKILEAGTMAPSGDNCQPWRFEIHDDTVQLFNSHNLDHPHFNFRQRGTHVAHGALMENIVQAADYFGFGVSIKLFPNSGNRDHTATFVFSPSTKKTDTLYPYIAQRSTNRKHYKKQSLNEEQRRELKNISSRIVLLENRAKIKSLGSALSVTERVALEVPSFHKFFFEHILWSAKEDREKIAGLYIKTMELPPPVLAIFRLIRNWNINKYFNAIGFPKLAAKANAGLYTSAPMLALFTLDQENDENFIEAGRLTQRFWLTLTKLGLSAQPITGALYLHMRIATGGTDDMKPEHIELIEKAHGDIARVFGVHENVFPMMLRVGYADPPSARSKRFNLDTVIHF